MRAARFLPLSVVASALGFAAASAAEGGRIAVDLSGPGWTMWHDAAARWEDDTLQFPSPPVEDLPVRPPTAGWAVLSGSDTTPVSVPGTVEEYLQKTPGPDGDLIGVSWWTRHFDVPAFEGPRRVLLRFESVRERAEVFVNRHLVACDIVGSTPFEIDITDHVREGEPCELAVRVTDPGGNFDWRDSRPMPWGRYQLPPSHGFGGITGRVRLVVCDPVYIDDLYVQNTPVITEANAFITIRNTTDAVAHRSLEVRVVERTDPTCERFRATVEDVVVPPGETTVSVKIAAPDARRWELDDPQLHVCEVALLDDATSIDSDSRTFGFRWFAPEGIGSDAVFRLNGRRVVLRSGISWGFWPINGIYPTPELAARQIRTAKAYGLNMLNFHRAIGNPLILDLADEMGLLYFEEPGAYKSVTRDPLGLSLVREKLLRMVRRDRSHPSLVIYNLINEWDSRNPNPDPAEIARHRDDMAAAHAIDPSRTILHTSAWARAPEIEDPAKLHFRPFDDTPHLSGWYDYHHAGGPAVWSDNLYRSPTDHVLYTDNRKEIVFWGEEGAISTPPRLQKIKEDLDALPRLGWDGGGYLEWFRAFDAFLDRKELRSVFPTVDDLTSAMGAVSLRHQGRRIENIRIGDVSDGYAINGWEAELIENHSGVVDCFRHPKGDPAILAYYNQPCYVALKVRDTIVEPGDAVVVDCFAINETGLAGPHTLQVVLREGDRAISSVERTVELSGGDVFGQLLAEAVSLPVKVEQPGLVRVEAALVDSAGIVRARGREEALVVDWRSAPVAGEGAVWESEGRVSRYLATQKNRAVPVFANGLGRLDWVVAARGPLAGEPVPVAEAYLRNDDGSAPGLTATFFADVDLATPVHRRVDGTINLAVDDGASPDPALPVMTDYGVRWSGVLRPPETGEYTFIVRNTGAVRLIVGGQTVIETSRRDRQPAARGTISLQTNTPVAVSLEFQQGRGRAECSLEWVVPDSGTATAANLLDRVRHDGTTLIVLQQADAWMSLLAREPDTPIRCEGAFKVGKTWLGGIHFVREHPLFAGLPVNGALDWPYQAVVHNGDERLGLLVEGEELVAGCYHSYPMQLGTAVGVVRLGRGRIVFSTLDICSNLNAPDGPAHVARKLLGNFLAYAGTSETP